MRNITCINIITYLNCSSNLLTRIQSSRVSRRTKLNKLAKIRPIVCIVLLETRVPPDTRASCGQVAIVGRCARASWRTAFSRSLTRSRETGYPRCGRRGRDDQRSIQRSEILAFRDTIPEISDHVFGQREDKGRKEGRQDRGKRTGG